MKSVMGSRRRRIVASIASVAVIVSGVGLSLNSAGASSTVTPRSGPDGAAVRGTLAGSDIKAPTNLFKVSLNSADAYMFSLDMSATMELGVSYSEADWDSANVPSIGNIARILGQTDATATEDPIEIAAAQAAIWHFVNGFKLAVQDTQNQPELISRYAELVADATNNPAESTPSTVVTMTPSDQTVRSGSQAFLDVKSSSDSPMALEISDAAVKAHPAVKDVCATEESVTVVSAGDRICLTSDTARNNVQVTLRTDSTPLDAGRIFVQTGRQSLIIATAGATRSSETVSVNWTTNGAPSVRITCPVGGIQQSENTTFTAVASDPDGDDLTFVWRRNGEIVGGATTTKISLFLNQTDKLTVEVSDSSRHTASATATCGGNQPPEVTLYCPEDINLGQDNIFKATGTDPDGDPLTYKWAQNGLELIGSTGPSITITVRAGDAVTVQAIDVNGASSATAEASCIPAAENHAPTVELDCPVGLIYGQPTAFTATASDADNDPLTYAWSVNGTVVEGQTSATATLTVNEGDEVAVAASDGAAMSAAATANCAGGTPNRPPTVSLDCPADLTYGEPTAFTATGTDPDVNSLTYVWLIDGTVVEGQTSATATLTVNKGDEVSVVASDGAAISKAAVETCVGSDLNLAPTVELTCPEELVWGSGAKFEASGTDPEGDSITYEWRIDGKVIPGEAGSAITAVLRKGDVLTVVATDARGAASASQSFNCSGNSRPTVVLTCPSAVFYGEPTAVTAIGIDDDGDPLTYRWSVNGTDVENQTGATATLTLEPGDRVNVIAVDATDNLASDSMTVQCEGTSRPIVTITCPISFTWDEPSAFIANGTDGDGDTDLTYNWYVNGVPVDDSGPKFTIALSRGDVLTVTVSDSTGATSAEAAAGCTGNSRPTVSLACPTNLIFDQPTEFTAIGSDDDPDSTLSYEWKVNDEVIVDETGLVATLTVARGDTVVVTAIDSDGARSASAESTCVGTSAPTIDLTCPKIITWGEVNTFTVAGTDEDGDSLTFSWAINGAIVEGEVGESASLTMNKGDIVTVSAADPTGLSSEVATFDCAAGERPTLLVTCPAVASFGSPVTVTASASGAETDDLAFSWAVNGQAVAGQAKSSIELLLQPGDVVGVSATTAQGIVSRTVGTSCSKSDPKVTVTPVPSTPRVLATAVRSAATTAALNSPTLAITGGSAGPIAVGGLLLAAVGALLLMLSRRRRV